MACASAADPVLRAGCTLPEVVGGEESMRAVIDTPRPRGRTDIYTSTRRTHDACVLSTRMALMVGHAMRAHILCLWQEELGQRR